MIFKLIEKLSKYAPNAVFTKQEAIAKAKAIVEKIVAENARFDEEQWDDDYNPLMQNLEWSADDCDDQLHLGIDYLLDDVHYLTWEDIDSLISSKLEYLESKLG